MSTHLIDAVAEKYANHSLIRPITALLATSLGVFYPELAVAFTAGDIMITARAAKIAERRVSVLLQGVEGEVKHLGEEQFDTEYINSEEFFDLFVKTLNVTLRTRHDEVIHLYARVLVNSLRLRHNEGIGSEQYLAALAELSLEELLLLKALYEQQGSSQCGDMENETQWLFRIGALNHSKPGHETPNDGRGQWAYLATQCPTVEIADMPFLLQRIARTGLIAETGGMGMPTGVYYITRTCRKLMSYIDAAPQYATPAGQPGNVVVA